ncbi:MAG: DUF3391 domain-containing protein [Arenicellales bacterium]|nr:DUF3391 domain-containing protein [Arenicellales bacterium]
MKRKVASRDLEVGMYIAELDRPWLQAPFAPPFEFQGFTIQKEEEVERIQKICRYVRIDPNRGKEAKRYLADGVQLKDITEVFVSLPATSLPKEVYKEKTSFEQEVPTAKQILADTGQVYTKIINDLEKEREIDAEEVKNAVSGLVESVLRNPEAVSWLVGLKQRDTATYVHAISVAVLALTVGRFLGLSIEHLEALGTATLLQDIGKMSLPDNLLHKLDRLDLAEREALKEHVTASVQMLEKAKGFSHQVIQTVRMHHERFDGSGYPQGLFGDDIPLLATISGIVDCYQAGISPRPYRKPKTSFEVLMELYGERDGAFPGGIVEQFIQCIGVFPIGSFVLLNTKEVGIVVRRNQVQQLKPKVMILIDPDGQRLSEPETVDLSAQYLEPEQSPRLIANIVDSKDYDLDPGEFFV